MSQILIPSGANPKIPLIFGTDTTPASPIANVIVFHGTTGPAGSIPFQFSGSTNVVTGTIQLSQAIAGTDSTKVGLAAFNSANFTVDANGFVSLIGGSGAVEKLNMQTGTSPVVGDGSGAITLNGATVLAGSNPIRTDGTGPNTATIEVQFSQAIGASDATKVGLSAFNSTQFTVDANGFVILNGAHVGQTITGDSGGALSPVSGNWSILGLSGSKTSGSGNTLTVKSPPFADASSSATSSLNTGEFVTGTFTRTLPASAGLADGDLIIYTCTTANVLTIQAVGSQKIRIGNQISSAAGTCVSSSIGDSISLRFRNSDGFWYAVSVQGNWTLA